MSGQPTGSLGFNTYYVFYVLKAKCSAVSERGRVGARKAFSAAMLIASC